MVGWKEKLEITDSNPSLMLSRVFTSNALYQEPDQIFKNSGLKTKFTCKQEIKKNSFCVVTKNVSVVLFVLIRPNGLHFLQNGTKHDTTCITRHS